MSRFYASNPESALRLGDIVRGFHVVVPKAIIGSQDQDMNLRIMVNQPRFLVVMTPCCSIELGSMILAPLSELRTSFFDNPYLTEDFTRINRHVQPKHSVPPVAWEKMPPEEKTARLNKDPGYVAQDCFIYDQHDLLPTYILKKKTKKKREDEDGWQEKTGFYMVDFKTLYRFESDQIQRNEAPPSGCKILQLTVEARKELRDKLTYFFSRPAQEDVLALQAQQA